MRLDISLGNADLYRGLDVQQLAGKQVLVESPETAIPILLANLQHIRIDPEEVVLTGGMAIWTYLVVFHAIHGRTKRIYYEDGRGQRVLIAAHG